VSDYNYILPSLLAQGGEPRKDALLPFDTVVLSAVETQPSLSQWGLEVLRFGLKDHGPPPTNSEIAQAIDAGKAVARRIARGQRVLVTCHMGLNRSGLIVALALVNLHCPAREAIKRIRKARGPLALGNRYFRQILRAYEEDRYALQRSA